MVTTLGVEDMLTTKFQTIGKRHFILAIEGIDSFLVKTASRPTVTTEEVAIPWMGSTRYIAGRTTFNTMTVTLHEAIAPAASQQVNEWLRLCFEPVSGRGGYADFYKRDIQLKMVDPVGSVIQWWDIKGAWITEANFGDLTYEGSEQVEISLTLRYDIAFQQF